MEKIIDLHIHTNCSDGILDPYEIIKIAKKNKVSYISITDHDTINAYSEELMEYAKKNNINLITGVEISSKGRKCGIHILGYNIDINNKKFKNELKKIRNFRHEYLNDVSKKLNQLGYEVNTKKLNKIESITKAHIAADIINNQNNKYNLLKYFGYIPNKGEFIEKIMNEGCPAYVKKKCITPREASKLIRNVGGKVVIAHPVAYTYEDNLNESDLLEIKNNTNADGIEAYYIYIDRNNIKHNDSTKWLKFAKRNNLFTTIGSDFHSSDGIRPEIGLINEKIKVSANEINNIIDNIIK